jgi:hypothetical protein
LPDEYVIKGSFSRKAPYVTDVDIVSDISGKIDEDKIYTKLLELIKKFSFDNDGDTLLVRITCGYDEKFYLKTGDQNEMDAIKKLLTPSEVDRFDAIMMKYHDDETKMIFYLNQMMWEWYRLRWSPHEIRDNEKILKGGDKITFTETFQKNKIFILQYFIRVGSYPIGFDVIIYYKEFDVANMYKIAAIRDQLEANYNKEYFCMLYVVRYYFRKDRTTWHAINDLIEKKYGIYKQFCSRIKTYTRLYETKYLTFKTAIIIVNGIMNDIHYLSDLDTNIIDKIKMVSDDKTDKITKMNNWYTLLKILGEEIFYMLNVQAKDTFYEYFNKIPQQDRHEIIIADDMNQSRIYDISRADKWLCKYPIK